MSSSPLLPHFILIAAAGAFLGFCLSSSPSSIKYLIAVLSALFFAEYRGVLATHNISTIATILPINHLLLFDVTVSVVFLCALILVNVTYPYIVKKIYYRKTPGFLNKMMSGREQFNLEHYLGHAKQKISQLLLWLFWILFALLFTINLLPISTLLVFFSGLICVFLIFTLPNIKENATEYFECAFLLGYKKKSHFRHYINYFAKKGITIRQNTRRGAGLSWTPKMLWTFAPFHVALFTAVFIVGQYKSIDIGNIYESILLVVLAFIALSPIIWADITNAPQISRLYSPGLITILLLPAYMISGAVWTVYTLLLFSGIGILTFAWNFWKFTDDVYPAHMTIRNLVKFLHQHGINDIYIHQTILNNFFIDAIPGIGKSEYLPKQDIVPPFRIHHIQRLDEVTDGWIAIPGTTCLAITSTGERISDDYTKDPILKGLIETKQIEKIAALKLKTHISSTIWMNEDEVSSYHALHLKDFGPDDFYRGHAWLIHSSKLKGLNI